MLSPELRRGTRPQRGPTAQPRVAQRTLGGEVPTTTRTLKAFHMASRDCTTPLGLMSFGSTVTQGALRDPGLCCETPTALSTHQSAIIDLPVAMIHTPTISRAMPATIQVMLCRLAPFHSPERKPWMFPTMMANDMKTG